MRGTRRMRRGSLVAAIAIGSVAMLTACGTSSGGGDRRTRGHRTRRHGVFGLHPGVARLRRGRHRTTPPSTG